LTIIGQMELTRYGIRVNAVAPGARTRLTSAIPGSEAREQAAQARIAETGWDPRDPGNIAPFVAYLATQSCPIDGRVFFVRGGNVQLFQPFAIIDGISKEGKWTVEELQQQAARLADVPFTLNAI
jgi:NAD(P)-dependent dehydrogenase (short-subunit alcohol dehydrogenase family)